MGVGKKSKTNKKEHGGMEPWCSLDPVRKGLKGNAKYANITFVAARFEGLDCALILRVWGVNGWT